SVSITNGNALDLNNNTMIVDYTGASPLAAMQALVQSGYNNGNLNGTNNAIFSTTAANANLGADPHKRAIGYAEASAANITNVLGTPVDSTAVVIRYTISGDANLDGAVNSFD